MNNKINKFKYLKNIIYNFKINKKTLKILNKKMLNYMQ